MKKSEMIEKIYQKSLDDDQFNPEQRSEKEVILHVIHYILTKAEEFGMLPPQKDDGRDVFLWSYVGDSFEWDPEDEAKENE